MGIGPAEVSMNATVSCHGREVAPRARQICAALTVPDSPVLGSPAQDTSLAVSLPAPLAFLFLSNTMGPSISQRVARREYVWWFICGSVHVFPCVGYMHTFVHVYMRLGKQK